MINNFYELTRNMERDEQGEQAALLTAQWGDYLGEMDRLSLDQEENITPSTIGDSSRYPGVSLGNILLGLPSAPAVSVEGGGMGSE